MSSTAVKRQPKKKLIGLIGENPNDTDAIQYLLEQKYHARASFRPLLRRVKGDQLNNNKLHRLLEIECRSQKPDAVLFIKDADGICTQADKINDCNTWYQRFNQSVSCSHTLLINIYELEALIFADIKAFNDLYKTTLKGGGDVSRIPEPKEALKSATSKTQRRYKESDVAEIFKTMNIETVIQNCTYFKSFVKEFEKLLK